MSQILTLFLFFQFVDIKTLFIFVGKNFSVSPVIKKRKKNTPPLFIFLVKNKLTSCLA